MSPETPPQPMFTLPFRTLVGAWCLLLLLFVAAAWIAPGSGATEDQAVSALIGALTALAVGVGSVLAIRPWAPRPSGDLPTIWLFVTVARLFATPVFALLIYFAARLSTGAFVLGIGAAYIALLFLETAAIVVDMRRQLAQVPAPENNGRES